jgi:hypothetical protein
MHWTFRPLVLDRTRLRRAALRYADHDWDITPGACLAGSRFICDRLGCPTTACHPALDQWEGRASHDPGQVSEWWRAAPHAVLLATGRAVDVLEAPDRLGVRVLGAAQAHRDIEGPGRGQVHGPVAVTPTGRWMFFVRPGDPLRPELEDQRDVVRHGLGSWVPVPPTRLPDGPVRWVVPPGETRWLLPDSYAVQRLLVDARALLDVAPAPARRPLAPLRSTPAHRAA